MAYVALKPCRLSGQSFKIGEIVPAENVLPGAAKNLVKMGIITEDGDNATAVMPQPVTMKASKNTSVVIHTKEGDMPLEVTAEGLQAVVDVLTSKVGEAETIINGMTDDDALILLSCCDSRKSIQELTATRAKALNEGAGEQ